MEDEDVMLDLQSLCVEDLKEALEQRCLSKSGPKSILIKRLKGALMLENLQRTSTPHSGLQPNSQIGEEMSQNSFIKQYLAKQQELLHQRLEREAREAAGANVSPAGPKEEDNDYTEEGNSSPNCPDKPAHSMLHLSRSTRSATVGSAAICLKKDREKDNDEEQEATGLVICTSPGGLQRQDLNSISSEPLAQRQPRVLRPPVHKMASEEPDKKRGKGELVSRTGPGEISTSEEPGDKDRRTKNVSMPVKKAIMALKNLNKSIKDIAKTLDVSKSTVLYIVKRQERTGDLRNGKRPGRPQKTKVLDEESEKAELSICSPLGGQNSELRSSSSSTEPQGQSGPLSMLTHKIVSEEVDKKRGKGVSVSKIGPGEVSRPEEPGTGKRRTKDLSMPVKQSIMRLKNENKSIRDIAKALSLSKSTVWNIVKKKERTGDLSNGKRPGRPQKTTVLDDQILLGIVEDNPFSTVEQIKKTLQDVGIDVSKNTIRRRLRQHNFERLDPQDSNHWLARRIERPE